MTTARAMAVILLLSGLACQRPEAPETEPVASLRLGLTLSPGVEVDVVSFQLRGIGLPPIDGSIDVRGDSAPATLLTAIPPGGYHVSGTATSRDGRTTCMGGADFSVLTGQTASVTVRLECRAQTPTGGIAVETRFNHCPQALITVPRPVLPSSSPFGQWQVGVSARDVEADTLRYSWVAPQGGGFDDPSSPSPVYTCPSEGGKRLLVTISDGQCSTDTETDVDCSLRDVDPCGLCVLANCEAEGPGCSSLTDATRRGLCESLFACARRTHCGGQYNPACWCGTVDLRTCISVAGAAEGPCLAEELAAAESSDPATIVSRFTDPVYASGAAHNRLQCEFELCADVCPPR